MIDHPNPFVDPSGVELVEVKALNGWLLADQDPKSVLDHMLRLDVVQLATSGAVVQEEQEVELVQVSCTDPEAITGMQMHHFGAFYRAPWRVNDWIEGRIDGAMQVVRLLAERLRQRGYTKDELLDHLHAIAVPPGPHQAFLEARWKERASAYVEEIDRVLDGTSTSAALDKIAEAVSMPLRLAALEEDLPALANAILGENGDTSNSSAAWLASYQAAINDANRDTAGGPNGPKIATRDLRDLCDAMRNIGTQTIKDDVGSDTFARSASHAAAVTAALLSPPTRLGANKAVRFALSTIRGYTAMLWAFIALLTRRSSFGTHAVEIAVAVGGALLAVTILVPGAPLILALLGVFGLLAGATASALLAAAAGRRFAARLGIATALFVAAVGYVAWNDINANGWSGSATQQALVKTAVGLAIVLLGAFVAQARPSKE